MHKSFRHWSGKDCYAMIDEMDLVVLKRDLPIPF
jgi:hypothetical protein